MKNWNYYKYEKKNNQQNFLIKWLKYSHSNNQWLSKFALNNVKLILKKYFDQIALKIISKN